MIKTLSLNNFQSHRKTELQLDPRVNVFTGPSGSGKSSIIRAIRLVAFNQPLGDSYCSTFSKDDTEVTIITGEDQTVSRIKGKSTNRYRVNGNNIDAFKHTVPEQVSDALNLLPINLQSQHDSPFLLSSSSGDIAQYINKMVNIDVIDRSRSYLNKQILRNSAELSRSALNREALATLLSAYDNLDRIVGKVTKAEEKQKQLGRIDESKRVLVALASDIFLLEMDLIPLRKKFQILGWGRGIITRGENKLKTTQKRRGAIELILSTIDKAQKVRNHAQTEMEKLKGLEKVKPHFTRFKGVQVTHYRLKTIMEELDRAGGAIKQLTTEKGRAYELYQAAIPSICPTCGQNWKKKNNKKTV